MYDTEHAWYECATHRPFILTVLKTRKQKRYAYESQELSCTASCHGSWNDIETTWKLFVGTV